MLRSTMLRHAGMMLAVTMVGNANASAALIGRYDFAETFAPVEGTLGAIQAVKHDGSQVAVPLFLKTEDLVLKGVSQGEQWLHAFEGDPNVASTQTGLRLDVSTLLPGDYTIDMVFRFTHPTANGYRRILDTRNRVDEIGLYANAAKLVAYTASGAQASGDLAPHPDEFRNFHRLVVTRDETKDQSQVYLDGLHVTFPNSIGNSLELTGSTLYLFLDNGSEYSGGQIAHLAVYDEVVSDAAKLSGDPMPAAVPEPPAILLTSLTAAAAAGRRVLRRRRRNR